MTASVLANRAAVMLTGHARTYDLTASSLRERVIKENADFEFWIFALTYSDRDKVRGHDVSKHTRLDKPGPTKEDLERTYGPRVIAKIVDEAFIAQQVRPRTNRHKFRVSMMFKLIACAFSMVRTFERRMRQPFSVVLKLRFDLKLLTPFRLRVHPAADGHRLIVPHHMDSGPSRLAPSQIRTRPCDALGRQRPTWLQDHLAYGNSASMALYANGTDLFAELHALKIYGNAVVILASFMAAMNVSVFCDPSLRYTILR